MHDRTSGSVPSSNDVDGGSNVYPPSDRPLSAAPTTGATITHSVLAVKGTHDDANVT